MNKLMTAATVLLGLVMIVITVTLAFSATNGAAAFTLMVLSIVLVGCVLAALDWGNSWYEAAMYAKGLMEGTASKMTAIKENTMTASALYPCPDHGHLHHCDECQMKYVGEAMCRGCFVPVSACTCEIFADFYAEEALSIMIEEAEAAAELEDEHYVGAHEDELQAGCLTCNAIREIAPPTEDDYPF